MKATVNAPAGSNGDVRRLFDQELEQRVMAALVLADRPTLEAVLPKLSAAAFSHEQSRDLPAAIVRYLAERPDDQHLDGPELARVLADNARTDEVQARDFIVQICAHFPQSSMMKASPREHLERHIGRINELAGQRVAYEAVEQFQTKLRAGTDDFAGTVTELTDTMAGAARGEIGKTSKRPKLVVERMDTVDERDQQYLIENRIPRGCLGLVGGAQGATKNLLCYDLIACVTTGRAWRAEPDDRQRPPGNVILLEAEEHANTMIKKRLVAAGADCRRVHLVRGTGVKGATYLQQVALQHDLDAIGDHINKIGGVDLIVVSPITAYMGDVRSVSNEEVRNKITGPLQALAETHNCGLLIIKHPNKEFRCHDPLTRVAGSSAFTEHMRYIIIVGTDPAEPPEEKNPRRVGFWEKWSLGPKPEPISWRIRIIDDDRHKPAVYFLSDPIEFTARDMFAGSIQASDRPTKRSAASDWIEQFLEHGPSTAKAMNEAAAAAVEASDTFSLDAYGRAKRQKKDAGRLIMDRAPGVNPPEWWLWLADGYAPEWHKSDGANVAKVANVAP